MSPLHALTQNDQIRHDNAYGEGAVLEGQSRHCIWTNASSGLLATAEFLIYTNESYAAAKVHQNALQLY